MHMNPNNIHHSAPYNNNSSTDYKTTWMTLKRNYQPISLTDTELEYKTSSPKSKENSRDFNKIQSTENPEETQLAAITHHKTPNRF